MTSQGRRTGRSIAVGVAVGILTVATVAASASTTEVAAETGAAIDAADRLTELAIETQNLASEPLVLAGGALALGIGLGIVVGGGATYWYKGREFRRRLE